ncbi:unnamed protein product [Ectocarpus sp. 4 AP-2014]
MDSQPSVGGLLAGAKAALTAGDRTAASQQLLAATKLAPDNPKAWRALADFLETGNDNKQLAEALSKCVDIAESKGNYGRSRPLRLRLSEVREAAGDRRGALAALKAFTSNPAAVSATTASAANGAGVGAADKKNASASAKAAAEAVTKAAEAVRDTENAAMKDRSTRLFMELNADLVPALAEHCGCLGEAGDASARRRAAVAVAKSIAASNAEAPWVEAQLREFLPEGNAPAAREGALLAIHAICELAGPGGEPYVVALLPLVLQANGAQASQVRAAAADAGAAVARTLNPHAVRVALPMITEAVASDTWRIKAGALEVMAVMAESSPRQVALALPEIVPVVSHQVWDTKREVQAASKHALLAACACIGNPDIEPLVDRLVRVIAKPAETESTLDALLATTFVTRVDRATLSVIAPLLSKCLKTRQSNMHRKAGMVIGNMCRLVTEAEDVAPFIPMLLPALKRAADETADLEAGGEAKSAVDALVKALGVGHVADRAKAGLSGPTDEENAKVTADMRKEIERAMGAASSAPPADPVVAYVASLCSSLVLHGFGQAGPAINENWEQAVLPYLRSSMGEADASLVYDSFLPVAHSYADAVEEGDAAELCNIDFSLAYGGKILLHNTRLRLLAGHRYGLLGPNGAGKTTLMRNIANGAIDGLPTELRTVFVQHDIVASDVDTSIIDYTCNVEELKGVSREKVSATLAEVGFSEEGQAAPITSLSGGWKMKLALARAMLQEAQVLLLDEPTNHLDVHAVKWLTDYLTGLKDVTVICVSHDTGFLEDMVTDVLHYETLKLVPYHGGLKHFISLKPEAKSYYELAAASLRFKFPNPGPLDGITSTTKNILTMKDCSFQYPGSARPQIQSASLKLCLASRVGVTGVNGAGKTTLIKMVVRETEPQSGEVWSHHNLRIAYMAQHSLHHVEQHLEKSPVQYMQWRFGTGDGTDREVAEKNILMKMTDEEQERQSSTGQVEDILGRRLEGRVLKYECSFVGMGPKHNRYISREELERRGLSKLVQQADARMAALAAGTDNRPVTTKEIQAHLDDFALAKEFSVYGKIGGLSGGQKVKLVLAAAMWMRPHLLVLDEPTNYLDREALGALTQGIKEFGGGVIIISHNSEFINAITTETWLLEAGRLQTMGAAQESELKTSKNKSKKAIEAEAKAEEEAATKSGGCSNKTVKFDNLINPKTLKAFDKKNLRKLGKIADKAGIPLPEYVKGLNHKSPEWKWLGNYA